MFCVPVQDKNYKSAALLNLPMQYFWHKAHDIKILLESFEFISF